MSFDQDDFRGGFGNNTQMRPQAGPPRVYQGEQDVEFTNKSQTIESSLFKLSSSLVSFTKMVDALGTPRDTPEFRHQFQNVKTSLITEFHSTEANIKQLGRPTNPRARVQQEVFNKRLSGALGEFKHLCESSIQKDKKALAAAAAKPPPYTAHPVEDEEESENASMMAAHRRREQENQQQLRAQMQFNQDMIIEREEGMKEIEGTMQEINDIFRDLSMAVHDQAGILDSIEANMVSSDVNVERGTEQLSKASTYQKSARSKMMCLLVIVAIVAAILVIVLVTQLRK